MSSDLKYSKEEFGDICYFMASILYQADPETGDKEFSKCLSMATESLEDIEKTMVI